MSSLDTSEPAESDIADESLVSEGHSANGPAEKPVESSAEGAGHANDTTPTSPQNGHLDPLHTTPEPSPKSSRPIPEPLELTSSTASDAGAGPVQTQEQQDPQSPLHQDLPLSPSRYATGRATPVTPGPKEPQPWDLIEPPPDNNNRDLRDVEEGRKFIFQSQNYGQHVKRKIPKSSYYFGPPDPGAAYGTAPMGVIGVHHPREIVRIERDYSTGEAIPQFAPIWPLELEGRITPTQFLSSINDINEILISAHSISHAFFDNALEVFTLGFSKLVLTTWYDKEMRRLQALFTSLNNEVYNPAGLNLLWPRSVGFMFLELEYY